MDFFRSPLLRRIIYALVFLLALMGLYSRLHAEPLDAGASLAAVTIAHIR
jgi:hypothetical protein